MSKLSNLVVFSALIVSGSLLGANKAPTVTSVTINTNTDATIVTGKLNGTDPEGGPLTFRFSSNAKLGTITFTNPATGDFSYTLKGPSYYGTDNIQFVANDGQVDSKTGSVTIKIAKVNHAPTTFNHQFHFTPGQDVVRSVKAGDPDGDSVSYSLVAGPASGTLRFYSQGLFRYTPPASPVQTAFTFVARDGKLTSIPATVTFVPTPTEALPQIQAPSNQQKLSFYGYSVALSGNKALVTPKGTILRLEPRTVTNQITAHFYQKTATGWVIESSFPAKSTMDGAPVAMSGDYAAIISGKGLDSSSLRDTYSIRIFHRGETEWQQESEILARDGFTFQRGGYEYDSNLTPLTMTSNVLAVTVTKRVYGKDPFGRSTMRFVQRVEIYRRSGATWLFEKSLDSPVGADDPSRFGYALSVTDEYLAVGNFDLGKVYLYRNTGSDWVNDGEIARSPTAGRIGYAFALNAGRVVIANGSRALIFKRQSGTWDQEAELAYPCPGNCFQPGYIQSVALDGEIVVLGAPADLRGDMNGAVFVFRSRNGNFSLERVVLNERGDEGLLGYRVAISDGNIFASDFGYSVPPFNPSFAPRNGAVFFTSVNLE